MQLPNAVVFCYCNDYLNLFNYSMFLIYFLISCLLLSLFTPVLVCRWLFALYTHSVFNWTHLPGTDWNDLTNLYLEFQVCYLPHNKEQSKTSGVPLDYFQKNQNKTKPVSWYWHRGSCRRILKKYWAVTLPSCSCRTLLNIFHSVFWGNLIYIEELFLEKLYTSRKQKMVYSHI